MIVPPLAGQGRVDVSSHRGPTVHRRRSTGSAQLCGFGRRANGLVAFAGELDALTGPRLEQYIAGIAGPTRLDLGAVTFMDTSGLETLQRVQQRCHVNGWSFKIESCSPAVERILQLVGVGHDLVDQDTAEEVIRRLDDVPCRAPLANP